MTQHTTEEAVARKAKEQLLMGDSTETQPDQEEAEKPLQQSLADTTVEDFDDLMDRVCAPGRFTWLMLIVAFVTTICPGAMSLGHALFLYTPDFLCDLNATAVTSADDCLTTVSEDQCSILVNCTGQSLLRSPCQSWIFDDTHLTVTMTTRFQLVCDRLPLARLPATLYFVGYIVGSTAYGVVTDRIGRRNALLAATINLSVFAFAAAAAPTYWLLLLAEAAAGAGTSGIIIASCALLVELTPKKYRSQVMFNGAHGWCFGIMIVALIAWLLPDYRYQLAITGAIGLAGAACVPAFGESPRWLLSVGRIDEAERAVCRIAKWNRRRVPDGLSASLAASSRLASGGGDGGHLTDLLRRPGLRRVTLLIWALFFSISFCYYGVRLGIGSLGGNVLLSCVFLSLVEPPSRFLGGILCSKFGRRPVLGLSFACIGVSIVACSLLFQLGPNLAPWRTACAIFGCFWSSLVFVAVWLFANEALPTQVRAVGAGSGSMVAKLGAMLSTVVAMLDSYWPPAPFAVFGSVAVATLVACFLLPETFGRKLPATLDEGDRFGRLIGYGSRPDNEAVPEAELEMSA